MSEKEKIMDIFEELLEIQVNMNPRLYNRSMYTRLNTKNILQVDVFFQGMRENTYSIDSQEKLEEFKKIYQEYIPIPKKWKK